MTDLGEIVYVHRLAIGGADGVITHQAVEEAHALLNRCLHDRPQGRILAIEHVPCFHDDVQGRHVFRLIAYHIGFTRRPAWLIEGE